MSLTVRCSGSNWTNMVNIYVCIIVEGALGVYLQDGDQHLQTNVLEVGETVGDLDVLDGERESYNCPNIHLHVCTVVEGALAVYLQDGDQRLQTNVLEVGETVGTWTSWTVGCAAQVSHSLRP